MSSMNKTQKALISLLQGDGIFYASMLLQMQRIDTKDLPEGALMGVSVQNGRIKLHIDETRLEKFSVDDVAKMLEHEVMHLTMEHLNRIGNKHPYIWNCACDLSVNCLINNMPVGLIPGKEPFQNFPTQKSAEFYYALLQNKIKGYTVEFNADGSITVTNDKTGEKTTIHPSGDHKDWKSSANDPIVKEVIKQAVEEAVKQVKKSQGRLPAGLEEYIKELLGKETVNWKKLLKQYVGNVVKADRYYSWKRENKRFGIDQKGRSHTRTLDIAVAIDTSGSISTEDFQEFITEIHGIMKSYKATVSVIECDAAVQKVYKLKKYGKVDTHFKGRGGTDFRPVFTYLTEKRCRPGLLVFFTDLCGSFPEKETVRTVWVATSSMYGYNREDQQKVPFGRLVQIPPRNKRNDNGF